MKAIISFLMGLGIFLFYACPVFAHCQIPCGIYDDHLRIKMIEEHITTIETSMSMIQNLNAAKEKDINQLIRWIDNKETHAQYIQDIVNEYFMTQRIKPINVSDWPENEKALRQLTLLHKLLIGAMKAKQTVDLENVKILKETLKEFEATYFNETEHKDMKH
ncbi:MAG: superoxide dismutase, Ni [Candidatus Omnitrophica bacterium]|nr:superoxide dismutase, Ni [Candidatus Omnitrophota bacterium]